MKPRPLHTVSGILLAFSLLVAVAACTGGGQGKTSLAANITAGSPRNDIVEQFGFNAYAAAVTPGALYKISLTNLNDDADLLVYGADESFTFLAGCSIDTTEAEGISSEDCILAATGSVLYFGVDGAFLAGGAAQYTISIERLPLVNLHLSLPAAGAITRTGAAAYAVSVLPGAFYTVAITGLNDDADLHVFGNDSTFGAAAACSIDNTRFIGTTPEDCTLGSGGGTLFFIVDGLFSSAGSVDYVIFAAPAPAVPVPANDGTATSPAALFADTPAVGQVAFGGTSYYAVSGLLSGSRYTASISGLTADAHLTVFGADGAFTNPAFCLIDEMFHAGTVAEQCTVMLSGSTLYFTVTSNTTSGGVAYITLVAPGP
jgi:hypothetical protein